MAKKTTAKKTAKKIMTGKDELVKDAELIGRQLKAQALELKKKFDKLDDQTKAKVIGGVAGTLAVLMGIHKMKKAIRRKK